MHESRLLATRHEAVCFVPVIAAFRTTTTGEPFPIKAAQGRIIDLIINVSIAPCTLKLGYVCCDFEAAFEALRKELQVLDLGGSRG